MLSLPDFQKKIRLPNLPPLFHEPRDFFQGQIGAVEAMDHAVVSCTDAHGGLRKSLHDQLQMLSIEKRRFHDHP